MGVTRLRIISRGRLSLPFKLHTEFSKEEFVVSHLLALKASLLSHYRGKEAVVPFPSRSWQL